jgi:hypothetical protein
MVSPEEMQLLGHHNISTIDFRQTKVFVTELNQLDGKNSDVLYTLFADIEDFLGIPRESLPRLAPENLAEKKHYSDRKGMTGEKKNQVLNICLDEHRELRRHLLEIGVNAAQWLEKYFLKSPNVVVSQPDAFVSHIRKWADDPCDKKQ